MSRIDETRKRWSRSDIPEQLFTAHVKMDIDYLLSCIEGRGVEDRDPRDMTDDELNAAVDFHRAQAARYSNEGAKIWRLRIRLNGGEDIDKKMLADLHARRAVTTPTAGGERCAEQRCVKCFHGRGIRSSGLCAARSDSGYYFCSCECVFPAPPEQTRNWTPADPPLRRIKVDPTPVPAEVAALEVVARGIVKAWLWHTPEHDQERARVDIERRLTSIFPPTEAAIPAGEVDRLNERIAELERRLKIPFGNLSCALCGGPHDFDTSVPSVIWNSVIRAKSLPDYLCTTCIVREFVRQGQGFTAELWNEEFSGVPIEVVVNGQNAKDAAAIQEENNSLRHRISTARANAIDECASAARSHKHVSACDGAGCKEVIAQSLAALKGVESERF